MTFDTTFRRLPTTLTRHIAVAVSLTGLLLVLPAYAQKPPQSAPPGDAGQASAADLALFNRALAATKAGKYAEAEQAYRQLLKRSPNVPAAWANLGLLVARRGMYIEAIRYGEKATQMSPETGAFWGQLSSYQIRAGRIEAGEKSARKALELDPKDVIALANLADALMVERRYNDAIPVLQQVRSIAGDKAGDRIEINLVLALNSVGRTSEGLTLARKRAEKRPKDPYAQLLLGDTARIAGQLPEAEKAYKHAATLDPKNRNAQIGLSYVATLKGDRKTAAGILQKLIQQTPDDARLYFQLGFLYYSDPQLPSAQRFPNAEKYFGQAVIREPKNPLYVTYQGLAVMLQGAERYAVADKLFRAALAVEPRFSMARMGLAYLAEQQKQAALAADQYRAILSYAPNDREARRGLAGALYASGKKTDAYHEMQTLIDQNPKDTVTLAELGSWQAYDGALDEASKTYGTLLERDPKNVPAMISLANVYERKKQNPEARKQYEKALTTDPKNAQAAMMLGNLLTQTDRLDEAVAVYRRLLDNDPTNNPVRWQLSQVLQTQKRYDDALKELQSLTLVKDDPNRTAYLLGAPRLMIDQKRYDEAIQELKRLEKENPREDGIRVVMAEAYEKSGKFAESERILKEMADRPRDKPFEAVASLVALGELYERAEKLDEAAANYEDALRFNLNAADALEDLKRVRGKQKKPEAVTDFLENLAFTNNGLPNDPVISIVYRVHQTNKTMDRYRDFTKRLLEKYPNSHVALIVRARAILEAGNLTPESRQELLTLAKKMTTQNPADADAQTIIAEQSEAIGKKEDAIEAYKMLLRINPRDERALTSLRRLGVDPMTILKPPAPPTTPPGTVAPGGAQGTTGTPAPKKP